MLRRPRVAAYGAFRFAIVFAVVVVIAALAVAIVGKANRWDSQPILTVTASDRSSRTLHVQIESCLQDDRVRLVEETETSIVLHAESKGSPDGDCVDGLATVCADQAVDERAIVDESSGEEVDLLIASRPDLPDCG